MNNIEIEPAEAPESAAEVIGQGLIVSSIPEIIVFEHVNFEGDSWRTTQCWNLGSEWNDRISSIIVVSGTWCLAEHHDYLGWKYYFGPGHYHNMNGIPNDQVSCFGYVV